MDEDTLLPVDLLINDIDTPLGDLEISVESGDLSIVPVFGYWIEGEDGQRTPVSYTHLRAHETVLDLVCRLLL